MFFCACIDSVCLKYLGRNDELFNDKKVLETVDAYANKLPYSQQVLEILILLIFVFMYTINCGQNFHVKSLTADLPQPSQMHFSKQRYYLAF